MVILGSVVEVQGHLISSLQFDEEEISTRDISALICRHQPPPPAVCLKHCGLVRRQLEMHVGQPCGVGGGYCGRELIMYGVRLNLVREVEMPRGHRSWTNECPENAGEGSKTLFA